MTKLGWYFLWEAMANWRQSSRHVPLAWCAKFRIVPLRECRKGISRHQLQRKSLAIDPGVHQGTCVTHVLWCMSGSLARDGGENVPGIPGACATHNFTYLARGPWMSGAAAGWVPQTSVRMVRANVDQRKWSPYTEHALQRRNMSLAYTSIPIHAKSHRNRIIKISKIVNIASMGNWNTKHLSQRNSYLRVENKNVTEIPYSNIHDIYW